MRTERGKKLALTPSAQRNFRDACITKPCMDLALGDFQAGFHAQASDPIDKQLLSRRQYFLARPILDHLQSLDYTRRFESVQMLAPRGRVLCRNARFNRKCAVATRHTGFARA